MKLFLHSLAGLLAASTSASAALVFTFNTTVTSAPGTAFSIGQPVTITLTTNDPAVLGTPLDTDGNMSASHALWYVEFTGTPQIWSDVQISGTTGSYVYPDGFPNAPYDELGSNVDQRPRVIADSETNSIGLSAGGESIRGFYFTQTTPIAGWQNFPNDATATLDNVFNLGTYPITTPTSFSILTFDGGINAYTLSGTDFTISDSAAAVIPEPSTYLAAASAIGLAGFIVVRRRKRVAVAE